MRFNEIKWDSSSRWRIETKYLLCVFFLYSFYVRKRNFFTFLVLACLSFFPFCKDYWCFPRYRSYLHMDHTAASPSLENVHSERFYRNKIEITDFSDGEKIPFVKIFFIFLKTWWKKNNCRNSQATAKKNKYFVRDIYFISGIIYDLQIRYNFYSTPQTPAPFRFEWQW